MARSAIVGDATISVTVNGDLDSPVEYIDILLDGFSLGRVFDNNTANDPFDFAGDEGNESASHLTGSATIANADFAPLIADGLWSLSFDFSSNVNRCGNVNLLEGSITYNSTTTPVPAPAALPLLLKVMGGMGVVASRRRRKT